MLTEWLIENAMTILIFGFTLLIGIGIGAGITDAINRWERKDE